MVAVNAVLHLTILTVSARIQAGQMRDGFQLLPIGLVIVLKTTLVALSARPTEIVVVAQFVVVFSFLDPVQHGLVDIEWGINAASAGVPGRLGRDGFDSDRSWAASLCTGSFGRQRQSDSRRRTGLLSHSRVGNTLEGRGSDRARGVHDWRGAIDQFVLTEEVVKIHHVGTGGDNFPDCRKPLEDGDALPGAIIAEDLIQERGVTGIMGDAQKNLFAVEVAKIPASRLFNLRVGSFLSVADIDEIKRSFGLCESQHEVAKVILVLDGAVSFHGLGQSSQVRDYFGYDFGVISIITASRNLLSQGIGSFLSTLQSLLDEVFFELQLQVSQTVAKKKTIRLAGADASQLNHRHQSIPGHKDCAVSTRCYPSKQFPTGNAGPSSAPGARVWTWWHLRSRVGHGASLSRARGFSCVEYFRYVRNGSSSPAIRSLINSCWSVAIWQNKRLRGHAAGELPLSNTLSYLFGTGIPDTVV